MTLTLWIGDHVLTPYGPGRVLTVGRGLTVLGAVVGELTLIVKIDAGGAEFGFYCHELRGPAP